MTFQILLNILIAFVWMMLHDTWNFLTFALGYIIGMILIFSLRRFFPVPFYGRRLWSIIKLVNIFMIELVKSGYMVVKHIVRPKLKNEPGIYKIRTVLRSDWEITLLSAMITLTPGSVVIEVRPEEGWLYIHAMDVPEFTEESIKPFEKAILEVTQ